MTRTSMITVSCGAVLLAAAAGCSSTGGCRTCKSPAASALATPQAVPAAAPASAASVAPASRYGGQVRCPVTGEELGSMGEPVAVTVGGRSIYVCCRGCAKRAEVDPMKTLAAVEAERAVK